MGIDSRKWPEWLRSSTRLILVLFAVSMVIFTYQWKVSWEQFLIARSMVATFFFQTRRKDWSWDPEDKFYFWNNKENDTNGRIDNWGTESP